MLDNDNVRIFENERAKLLSIAYRILGSLADAEDAVQDTFLTWAKTDREMIENPIAWLTTIYTRRSLDLLRSVQKNRVNYVGSWLPEPIQTVMENDAETQLALASSLATAFLLMLERLTPKERAAYLLYDIFDVSYSDIAETLNMQETACRKLVSRAKANIEQTKVRYTTTAERQDQLLFAFQTTITSRSATQFASLLSDDIRLCADGGGKAPAILNALQGKTEVIAFLLEQLHHYWIDYQWVFTDINGSRGILLNCEGSTVVTVSFAFDETDKASNIYIVRNPDKLAKLSVAAIR